MQLKSDKRPPSELRAISREVNKMVDQAFTVAPEDSETLEKILVTWDDLVSLKNELASQVLNLVHNVTSISSNPQITSNLAHPENFSKLVQVFFQDVNEYSSKVKVLRDKHEHHTGKILSIAEFEEYNKLAVEYYGLSEELIHVLAPTVTELVLMSNADVTAKIQELQQLEAVNVQPI